MKSISHRSSKEKKELTKKEQVQYLLSQETVNFSYPCKQEGRLLDRVVDFSSEDDEAAVWNVIDLIKFENEESNWIRMTYWMYKKKEKKWNFAGQTSIAEPEYKLINLFVKGIREKEWVRSFFKTIYDQCGEIIK
jgi:hypothetical protein